MTLVSMWGAGPASASTGLELIPDPVMLLVLIVAFGVLIFPVNALVFKPLFRVIDERDQKIRGARERAEELEREAEALLARYRASIDEVRVEAEVGRRGALAEARSEQAALAAEARGEAENELARARSELEASRGEASATLRGQARDIASVAAERILGRPLQ